MKTKAVRLYGKNDLRLEEFELPPMQEDEILARVVSDSLCTSSYKAACQGPDHKRVPNDVAQRPVIIGHEFCGEILQVGSKWSGQFRPGQKFAIQPALNYKGTLDAPGYSYQYIGGDATYVIIPNEVMEMGCLLVYEGDSFFGGSLAEPFSCVAGTFHAMYHTVRGSYVHDMGIKAGGNMAILAGVGPMGLAALEYILHSRRRPGRIAVTGTDQTRLNRAKRAMPPEKAAEFGIVLEYINISGIDAEAALMDFSQGHGYDDMLVFAPVPSLVELGDSLLAEDGCLNFFSGPSDPNFSAKFNFYNVHYAGTHVVGTSGGSTADMQESLDLMAQGLLDPALLVTHIGGLDCVVDATLNMPGLPSGKKLIYTGIEMPLTAIDSFQELGKASPLFARLHEIVSAHNGLWCAEAEKYLLEAKANENQ